MVPLRTQGGEVIEAPSGEMIVVYDAECRFCVAAKEGIERLGGDAQARFVPYQSEEAGCRLGKEYTPGRPEVAYVIKPDGTVKLGLDAFLPLLPGLPGGRFLLHLVTSPLLRPVADRIYAMIARNRYRWFGAIQSQKND